MTTGNLPVNPPKMPIVEINSRNGQTRVVIDGHEVPNVCDVQLDSKAEHFPKITVSFYADVAVMLEPGKGEP